MSSKGARIHGRRASPGAGRASGGASRRASACPASRSVFELFDHTADLGLRVLAPDRETLWREAAEGLFAVIVEADPGLERPQQLSFALEAARDDYLFV